MIKDNKPQFLDVEEILRYDTFHTMEILEQELADLKNCKDIFETSAAIRDKILPAMSTLRGYVDAAEMLTSAKYWPYPSYGKLLFSVQ